MKLLFIATLFCLWCMFITVHAQFDDEVDFGDDGSCPANMIKLYDKCRGSLDQCSACLGEAERKCEAADKSGNCFYCTRQAAGNCNSAKPMCFGNQECDGVNYKCLDLQCVYVSPS